MRPARAVPKVRVNLDLHPDVKSCMERIKDRIQADSLSEVVRRALIAYEKSLEKETP